MESAPLRRPQQRGRLARDLDEPVGVDLEPRERAHQPPGVRVLRAVEEVVHVRLLDDLGRVHDDDVVRGLRNDSQVVRDHDDRAPELFLEALHQVQDLRLSRHVERCRRLVRDQEVRVVDQRHRDHHALAHPARELVRIVVDPPLRLGDPDGLEQLEGARSRDPRGHVAMQLHRFDELLPDRVHGVQRRHRILEDHRHLVAANPAQLARLRGQQVLALPQGLAARDRVLSRVQAHDRQAGHALAAARLAHDAEGLSLLDRERDAVDRLEDAVLSAEGRTKVLYFEKCHGWSLSLVGFSGRPRRTRGPRSG